jgi:hypothetical protein
MHGTLRRILRWKTLWAGAGAALLAAATPRAAQASELYASSLRGNIADQVIAGFASSTATWDLARGRVTIIPFGSDHAVVVVRTTGLVIPALGFNPSPDLLARIVCHDEAGTPAEAARTRSVPFPQSGNATLVEVVSIPDECFAPIVLLTGSLDPQGESPGKFFAVSGF